MPKADKMLAILWLLRTRRRMTARQLAEELEVHVRTIYRCIDALCISGVPIVSETGRDGGYRIPDSFKQEPLFFDADEQKALLQAAAFARESGYPSETALSRAVAKIKRFSNAEQLERMERHESSLEVVQPPTAPAPAIALREIERAIELATSLAIEYHTGYDGSLTRRIFDPYGLVYWKSRWYAVGYCRLRGELRSFRVDRMRAIRSTDLRFERPPGFSARDFLLDGLLPEPVESGRVAGSRADPAAAPDTAPGAAPSQPRVALVIEGTPQALDDLCSHWLLGRVLEEREPDRARFLLDEYRLYTQLPYYLLSYGGAIRIAEPAGLRACMAEIAEALHRYYRA